MIYYDITDLFDHFRRTPRVTGMQRVSVATIARLGELGKANEVQLIAFHPKLRKTVVCDLTAFPIWTTSGPTIAKCLGGSYKNITELDDYISRRYKSAAARYFNKARLILTNALTKGATFRRKGLVDQTLQESAPRAIWRDPRFIEGDVILLTGGLHMKRRYFEDLSKVHTETGVRLAQFVHDVLPITDPQFFWQGHPLLFANWLININRICDLVITTTERNKRDFETVIRQRGGTPPPAISVVPLAHEFISKADSAEKFSPIYESVSTPVLMAARLPYVLCVGTREIRKNNLGLARVWERLEGKYGLSLPRLLFAGRQGWMNDEFDSFLKRTPKMNDYIVIVDHPSDEELRFLYQNCLFSAFPSFSEGWGLPIGESLWFGRPVITSHVSSMPEVAGDYADYVDPYNLDTLQTAVEQLLDPDYRESRIGTIKSLKRRLWNNFADDLWRELQKLHHRDERRR